MISLKPKSKLNLLSLLSGLLVLIILITPFTAWAEEAASPTFESLVGELTTRSYKDKERIISELAQLDDERVLAAFSAMLKSKLFYRKSDKLIVIVKNAEDGYQITNVVTGESLGVVGKRKVKKVSVNNKLRRVLSGEIAKLSLKSSKAQVRLSAVNDMIRNLDDDVIGLLRTALQNEKDA